MKFEYLKYFYCPNERTLGKFQLFVYIYYRQRLSTPSWRVLRVWDLLIRRMKDWDPETGDEAKPRIKRPLSLKQAPLVERVSFVNQCWNSHWRGTFTSGRRYILKEKESKTQVPEEQIPRWVGDSTQAAQAAALEENRAILWQLKMFCLYTLLIHTGFDLQVGVPLAYTWALTAVCSQL